MQIQMKLQKILTRLQKLHPKEIDLSLHRIKKLTKKLGNPQDNLNCIQVCGTNGKFSTIAALRAILKEANYRRIQSKHQDWDSVTVYNGFNEQFLITNLKTSKILCKVTVFKKGLLEKETGLNRRLKT